MIINYVKKKKKKIKKKKKNHIINVLYKYKII